VKLTIRAARPDDAEPLIAHIQHLIAEPGINIPLAPGEFKLTVDEERQALAGYEAADNSVFLVAEIDSQLVGQLNCKGGARRATHHAVVLGMSVRQEWRGQGIGAALLTEAIRWARQSGLVSRIELQVYARNEAAIRLYQKFGFEIEGRRRQVIYQNGEYLDDLIMALLL
jgi:RimJ/RimL family protein N-acetyltransferase